MFQLKLLTVHYRPLPVIIVNADSLIATITKWLPINYMTFLSNQNTVKLLQNHTQQTYACLHSES